MEREMVEIKEPKMVKFEHNGQEISGVLIGMQKVNVKEKPTIQYVCANDDGETFTFLTTYDLSRKLSRKHVGHFISVRFMGVDPSVKTQGDPMRLFKVMVSRQKEIASSLEITDDDIPF